MQPLAESFRRSWPPAAQTWLSSRRAVLFPASAAALSRSLLLLPLATQAAPRCNHSDEAKKEKPPSKTLEEQASDCLCREEEQLHTDHPVQLNAPDTTEKNAANPTAEQAPQQHGHDSHCPEDGNTRLASKSTKIKCFKIERERTLVTCKSCAALEGADEIQCRPSQY